MTPARYRTLVVLLGSLSVLTPFSIDMYLPGFRDIARSLHTTVSRVSLSLAAYFVGISVGQLLYGPLLDRFGRKRPLYAGLGLYIVSTAFCGAVNDIDWLIALRFTQAIGGCSAMVAATAMVRDFFGAGRSARVFSLLLLAVSASPLIAPTLGGYVVTVYGWKTVFLILLCMAVLLLVMSMVALPDPHPPDPSFSLRPRSILRGFGLVLGTRAFLVHALAGAVAFAALFAYVTASPLVFLDIFQVSRRTYGWIFAFLSLGFIGLAQFNSPLLKWYSSSRILSVALFCQAVVSVAFLATLFLGGLTLGTTIGFLFVQLLCVGFAYPNATALCLAPFERNAGTAAALQGALQMGVGTCFSILVSVWHDGTVKPLVLVMAGTSLGALGIFWVGRARPHRNFS